MREVDVEEKDVDPVKVSIEEMQALVPANPGTRSDVIAEPPGLAFGWPIGFVEIDLLFCVRTQDSRQTLEERSATTEHGEDKLHH